MDSNQLFAQGITTHLWCDGHSKYKCLWGVGGKAGVQVSKRELHTHIHLD